MSLVGGGSAGCVIASRLSEDPQNSILLLDAGGDGTYISDIPGAVGALYGNPSLDWSYKTEPESNSCLAMNGRKCSWHRGKSIGGTSTINGMLYVRGAKEDYDEWKRLGNAEWGYEDVLPFFKNSEGTNTMVLLKQFYQNKTFMVYKVNFKITAKISLNYF